MLAISVTVHNKITAAAATFGVNSGVTPEISVTLVFALIRC